AASGKTALLRGIGISVGAASECNFALFDTQLATDNGAGFNLLDGGAASVSHGRSSNPAAPQGNVVGRISIAANTPFFLPIEWFAQLAAGQGFLVATITTNLNLDVMYLWTEQ